MTDWELGLVIVVDRVSLVGRTWVVVEGGGKVKPDSSRLLSKLLPLALFCLVVFPSLRCDWDSPDLKEWAHGGQRSDKEVFSNLRLQISDLHVFCILTNQETLVSLQELDCRSFILLLL